MIGRMSTTGVVTAEYPLAGAMTPDAIVQGVDGNFYFTDTAANKIGQFFFRGHNTSTTIRFLRQTRSQPRLPWEPTAKSTSSKPPVTRSVSSDTSTSSGL